MKRKAKRKGNGFNMSKLLLFTILLLTAYILVTISGTARNEISNSVKLLPDRVESGVIIVVDKVQERLNK